MSSMADAFKSIMSKKIKEDGDNEIRERDHEETVLVKYKKKERDLE